MGKSIQAEFAMKQLREMKLTSMAHILENQVENSEYESMPFMERLQELISAEHDKRHNAHLALLIRKATFSQTALMSEIAYLPERSLDKKDMELLETCNFMRENQNIFITGKSGAGKTYIACALGMEACKQRYRVKYIRLPDLLQDMHRARREGRIHRLIPSYSRYDLLIIDEWLLVAPTEVEIPDILEIIESRHQSKSTIICSQYGVGDWYDLLGGGALAEAILDRLTSHAYPIAVHSEESMRRLIK